MAWCVSIKILTLSCVLKVILQGLGGINTTQKPFKRFIIKEITQKMIIFNRRRKQWVMWIFWHQKTSIKGAVTCTSSQQFIQSLTKHFYQATKTVHVAAPRFFLYTTTFASLLSISQRFHWSSEFRFQTIAWNNFQIPLKVSWLGFRASKILLWW